jgi:hypothetical protein
MVVMVAAATASQGIEWPTVMVSLLVGLGGGVVSALVTGGQQRKAARSTARAQASTALWNFQRTLHDFAMEMESPLIRDGTRPLTNTTAGDIAAQRVLAYPHKSYLGENAKLVARLWYADWEQGMDPMVPSDDVWQWSKDLDAALTATFGKDSA